MLTLGSLFDGIGGFPLAGIHNGITPLWASEIEPFPIQVTKLRFPDMEHVGDITKLDGGKLPPVDVICGGSPCQDLSVAGQRRGLAGERSGLFMDQVRIVKEMREADAERGIPDYLSRPRYLVWENVPGAFSSSDSEDFRAVIEEIVRIKKGSCHVPRPDTGRWESAGAAILGTEFSLAWRVLDAQYWGVAQRRRRIFLVADFGGLTAPQILFKQDCLLRDSAKGEGERKGSAASIKNGADDPGGGNRGIAESSHDLFTAGFCGSAGSESRGIGFQEECSPTIKTGQAPAIFCLNDQGGSQMHLTENVSGTLRAQEHGAKPLILANQQSRSYIGEGVCPTITAAAGTSGNNQPVLFENHGIDARYTGPHEVAPTMSARYGTGGNNVPLVAEEPESYCISGNIIDRQEKNGGNGFGCQSDLSYTLTATDRHAVFSRQRSDEFMENEVTATQSARQHKDATDLVCQPEVFGQSQYGAYAEGCATIRASGGDHGGGSENLVAVTSCQTVSDRLIRRLTPLECERLQGFPDGWTDIPGASDSARYKALGNSVAIPCVDFVLRGIAYFLQKRGEKQ